VVRPSTTQPPKVIEPEDQHPTSGIGLCRGQGFFSILIFNAGLELKGVTYQSPPGQHHNLHPSVLQLIITVVGAVAGCFFRGRSGLQGCSFGSSGSADIAGSESCLSGPWFRSVSESPASCIIRPPVSTIFELTNLEHTPLSLPLPLSDSHERVSYGQQDHARNDDSQSYPEQNSDHQCDFQ